MLLMSGASSLILSVSSIVPSIDAYAARSDKQVESLPQFCCFSTDSRSDFEFSFKSVMLPRTCWARSIASCETPVA